MYNYKTYVSFKYFAKFWLTLDQSITNTSKHLFLVENCGFSVYYVFICMFYDIFSLEFRENNM